MGIIFFDELFAPPVKALRTARVMLDDVVAQSGQPLSIHIVQSIADQLFEARVQAVALLVAAKVMPTPDPDAEEYQLAEAKLAATPGAPTDAQGNRTLLGLVGHFNAVAAAASDYHGAVLAMRDAMTVDMLWGLRERTAASGVTGRVVWADQTIPADIADAFRADARVTALRGALAAAGV